MSQIRLEELIGRDRQIANPFSRSIVDRIRNGRGRARDSDFTDSLGADRTYFLILLIYPENVDGSHVGIGGDMIFSEIVVHDLSGTDPLQTPLPPYVLRSQAR